MNKREIRKRYMHRPLPFLRALASELAPMIAEIERGPRREMDIAWEFDGDPSLIAHIRECDGRRELGKWTQLQTIYCSASRCPQCPHGYYWYRYRSNKRKKTNHVEYAGRPVFDLDRIDELRSKVREPIWRGELVEGDEG